MISEGSHWLNSRRSTRREVVLGDVSAMLGPQGLFRHINRYLQDVTGNMKSESSKNSFSKKVYLHRTPESRKISGDTRLLGKKRKLPWRGKKGKTSTNHKKPAEMSTHGFLLAQISIFKAFEVYLNTWIANLSVLTNELIK